MNSEGINVYRVDGRGNTLNGGYVPHYFEEVERRGNTFKHMTEAQEVAIFDAESRIRHNYDHEEGYFVKADGTLIPLTGGKTEVYASRLDRWKAGKDAIMIHNHPYYNGKGIRSIGYGLNDFDLKETYFNGMKGVRAVTGRYTFSMIRKSGEQKKVSKKEFDNISKQVKKNIEAKWKKYKETHKVTKKTKAWYDMMYWHEYCKGMAKRLGWEYSHSMDMSARGKDTRHKVKRSRLVDSVNRMKRKRAAKEKNTSAISRFARRAYDYLSEVVTK